MAPADTFYSINQTKILKKKTKQKITDEDFGRVTTISRKDVGSFLNCIDRLVGTNRADA